MEFGQHWLKYAFNDSSWVSFRFVSISL